MAVGLQPAFDLDRLVVEAVRDRQNYRLSRREPDRKRSLVMLDQDAEKPLERSQDRAVHHDRLMRLVVRADVFEAEPLRQVEIDLNRRELPQPFDRVHDLEVDLRTVERRLVLNPRIRQPVFVQSLGQRRLRQAPDVVRTEILRMVRRVTDRKLGLVFESESLKDEVHQVETAFDLRFQLLRRAEDVGVVLRESARPHQPVRDARTLVAINRAVFRQPNRQVAIRTLARSVNLDVERAIHRLEPVFYALVLLILQPRVEHVLVHLQVAGDSEKLRLRDIRRVDEAVAAPVKLVVQELLDYFADQRAVRMP